MDGRDSSVPAEELLREAVWIRTLARALSRDDSAADDVEQATWLALLRARPSRERALTQWLARVARNFVRSERRTHVRQVERERDSARPEALPDTAELVGRAEVQRLLVDAVIALEEPYRGAILLRYYEGLEPIEIAKRRGLPPATVRSHLSRGVQRLREHFDRRFDGDRDRWMSAFAPSTAGALTLGVLMKKLTLVAAGVLVLGWGVWRVASRFERSAESREAASQATGALDKASSAAPASAAPASERTTVADVPVPVSSASARAAFRGRLVARDDVTPVPLYPLRVKQGEGEPEALTTNLLGRFTTQREYAAGELQLELCEIKTARDVVHTKPDLARAASTTATAAHALDARGRGVEIDVPIDVGPAWSLDVAWPAGRVAEDFEASLACANPRAAFDRVWSDVHPGAPYAWIRFTPLAHLISGGPPWTVTLRSADGFWAAAADVTGLGGARETPLVLLLEQRARCTGHVTRSDDRPVARQHVQLWRDGASFASATNRPVLVVTDGEGRFDARAVPAGDYELKVEVDGCEPFAKRVALAAGRETVVDVLLTVKPEPPGRIAGRVTSRTGRYEGKLTAVAESGEGRIERRDAPVHWSEENGVRMGRFEIEKLEDRAWRVQLRVDDVLAVEPAQRESGVNAAELAFEIEDSPEGCALAFRAVDAESGEPLDAFRVWLDVTAEGRTFSVNRTAREGVALFTGAVRGTSFDYKVTAERRQPLRGRGAFTEPDGAMVVRLARGWGAELRVRDAAGQALSGARVLLDGALVGETDVDGKLDLALDHTPTAIRVEYREWRMVPDSTIDENGRFRSFLPWVTVTMRPPE